VAYKIGSTQVISNSRALSNLTGASGKYDDLRGSYSTITTVVDMNKPLMSCVMTGNVTFSESNKAVGKSAVLVLDRSSSGHTPIFSTNVKWANDIEPNWSSYRYWNIALVCWDSTTIRASASGLGSTGGPAPSETITLSGTSSSYNFRIGETANPNPCTVTWFFNSDGTVEFFEPDLGTEEYWQLGTEWCNVTPSTTYYIRATETSGTTDTGNSDALNTWLAISSPYRRWCATASPPYTNAGASWKIEIATDSAGTNIVATGYYAVLCSITP
jgi:hypothetical protein